VLIRAENLHYTYGAGTPLAREALRGVTLSIDAGESVGLVGPTGSGKSTLVQILAGLLTPTAGHVWLDGIAPHRRSADARAQRRRVGLAFQIPEDQIFEQTVYREVAFGLRNRGQTGAELEERVHWALRMVGMEPDAVVERVPFTLSGGEMRRVALASILATQPEVLILDEPTAGLDPGGRRELLNRVRAWHQSSGSTLVVVSHNLDELARMTERAVLLVRGQVAADGPAQQVLSDRDLLLASGLDVPPTVALLQRLREAGWDVRTDFLLPEQAVAEIVRVRDLVAETGDLAA
jgi:energy-coupling factor transport system ATP-binding protein